MRIAFVTQCRPCRELGGGRAQLEIAGRLGSMGHDCAVLGPDDLAALTGVRGDWQAAFETWLAGAGRSFDVVDYDHNLILPERHTLPANIVYVARSVLFIPFLGLLPIAPVSWAKKIRRRLWRIIKRDAWGINIDRIVTGLRRADMLTVPNTRDAHLAAALGIAESKTVAVPFLISNEAHAALREVAGAQRRKAPLLVFCGTFNERKGAPELPEILGRVLEIYPDATLRILGGASAHANPIITENRIRMRFPRRLRRRLEVVPVFENESLPGLLEGAWAGVFPSRWEGLPFAVMEMLNAGLPVAAYDVPGPCDLLPADWLAPIGDTKRLTERLLKILAMQEDGRVSCTERALAHADQFQPSDVTRRTVEAYSRALAEKRS